ncbi:hypothetical protein [Polyangium aurulentum]|uniref:hypothetical protein n=1 Tax=Polyangium aurulentum TaxID=2567896 RepID=UPI001F2ECF33|nr:hypothetical protein [Polyangium aurulentum]
MQEAVEDAAREGDRGRGEQGGVLGGVDPALRLAGRDLREEAGREGVPLNEAQREDGHLADAVQELRDVAARGSGAARREGAHDGFGVVEGEAVEGDLADDRVDVVFEPAGVVGSAALQLDMVGIVARELAAGPALADLADRGDDVGAGGEAGAGDGVDGAEDVGELGAFARGGAADEVGGEVGAAGGAEALGEVG